MNEKESANATAMSERHETKRCPRCGEKPLFTSEEEFATGAETWSVLHVCKKGFSISEGPCVSISDARDAWNLQVDEVALAKGNHQ